MKIALAFIVSVVLSSIVLWKSFRPIFGDQGEYLYSFGYSFLPDFVSFMRGKLAEDIRAELKLKLWISLGIAVFVVTFFIVVSII